MGFELQVSYHDLYFSFVKVKNLSKCYWQAVFTLYNYANFHKLLQNGNAMNEVQFRILRESVLGAINSEANTKHMTRIDEQYTILSE